MKKVYIYALDGLADWELGYIKAELNSKRFFKADAPEISVETVGFAKRIYKTMGGMKLEAELTVKEMNVTSETVLLLFGADAWNDNKHKFIIEKAKDILQAGGVVAGICGATVALANGGLLNGRKHTSNDKELLKTIAEDYRGGEFYRNEKAVSDEGLITAGSAGAIEWTKLIIDKLGVFKPETLEFWYKYYSTGKPEFYYSLMGSMQ